MTSKITFILILSFLILSCGEKSNKKNTAKIKKDSLIVLENVETESEAKNIEKGLKKQCKCYNGIGSSDKDMPILTFDFSNGKSVSICGYKNPDSRTDELLISEFNIFDCLNGKQFVEYGAVDNCLIETENDTIKIQLLKFLPIGENWKWSSIKVAEQIITPDLNKLKVSELTANYSPILINKSKQKDFLDSLKKGQGFSENWEENIGKLEVLSLNGNDRAWEILKNYEEFTGEQTDGALAEMWKEAIATVKWLVDKK